MFDKLFLFVFSTDFLIIYHQAIMIFNWSDYTPITYGDYTFPIWAEVVGYGIAALSLICIPAGMVKAICETSGDTYIMVSRLKYLSFTRTCLPLVKHCGKLKLSSVGGVSMGMWPKNANSHE